MGKLLSEMAGQGHGKEQEEILLVVEVQRGNEKWADRCEGGERSHWGESLRQ